MIPDFIDRVNDSSEPTSFEMFEGPMKYIFLIGFSLYFCKDIINGRSISKRILKLQVVDNRTGQVATPIQCVIRNLFCVLWPVEVLVAVNNTSRRLGDRAAGTKLVYYKPPLEQPRIKILNMLFSFMISYGFGLLIDLSVTSL
jgi:uncharacterized RDD family membrane protein YckC